MTINKSFASYIIAFDRLKDIITNYPIRKYPEFKERFKLTTDASNFALCEEPISCPTRTLNDHERDYSAIEKEMLAIVWGTKYFRRYLFGKDFDLKTDHQPIKWLQTKYTAKDINPRLQRG